LFQKPIFEGRADPQGLKSAFFPVLNGMAKAMPLRRSIFETSSKDNKATRLACCATYSLFHKWL
jgi:hypothetical protein